MSETLDSLRAALEERLRFETIVADLSAQFVNLDSDLIDGAIQDAQRRIVEALDLDRSSLFQFSDDAVTMVFTHDWSRPEFAPLERPVNPVELFPWATAQILQGKMVCFSSVDELPPGVADRANIMRIGTRSNVTLPLLASGRVVGALAFGSMRSERPWPPELLSRLSVVGQVFANALARKLTETELREALAENARLRDRLTVENVYLRSELKARREPRELTRESATIRRVQEQIDQVAPTSSTVLLLGETGTGKELIAASIHDRSPRAGRTMVKINCSAIPQGLIENELFGREKGAYTATAISRPRWASGTFREDLYYRLNVFPIVVPPLRDRPRENRLENPRCWRRGRTARIEAKHAGRAHGEARDPAIAYQLTPRRAPVFGGDPVSGGPTNTTKGSYSGSTSASCGRRTIQTRRDGSPMARGARAGEELSGTSRSQAACSRYRWRHRPWVTTTARLSRRSGSHKT